MVTAATEDEAKALAAQRALDGELTWQIQDNNVWRLCPGLALLLDTLQGRGMDHNKYPPAKPEVLRLLAPQRGLTAIATSKPKTEKTTNDGRLPELSNFESPPAEPGVYHD